MENYDFSQLQKGDTAAYMLYRGWGGYSTNITITTVDRFTTTQIVMKDGSRFRRDTGRKVGGDGCLIDPKGSLSRSAAGKKEASEFSYALGTWEKTLRQAGTLEAFSVCLAQLEGLISEAKRRIVKVEKEMEA